MTTVRIRALRKKTREIMGTDVGSWQAGATLEKMTAPAEVLVFGKVRAVVHFPKNKPALAWAEHGWAEHGPALGAAAQGARVLSDATASLWRNGGGEG